MSTCLFFSTFKFDAQTRDIIDGYSLRQDKLNVDDPRWDENKAPSTSLIKLNTIFTPRFRYYNIFFLLLNLFNKDDNEKEEEKRKTFALQVESHIERQSITFNSFSFTTQVVKLSLIAHQIFNFLPPPAALATLPYLITILIFIVIRF